MPSSRLPTRIRILATLAALSCGRSGASQAPVLHDLAGGLLRFSAPSAWRIVNNDQGSERSTLIFEVPLPTGHTGRGNVIVTIFQGLGDGDLRSVTDPFVAALVHGPVIAETTLAAPDRRFLFWRGDRDGVPYVITDDFSWHSGLLVHVTMALPLGSDVPEGWTRAFSSETEALLASVRLHDAPAFPGWAAHPRLSYIPAH